MHHSSFEKMRAFREAYVHVREGLATEILDVGSASFAEDDGYRPLFDDPAWRYRGLDLAPARNVDVVAASPYDWSEVADESVDIVVSGQAFEPIA